MFLRELLSPKSSSQAGSKPKLFKAPSSAAKQPSRAK